MPGLDPQRVAAARLWAAHRFPYLASGLFAVRMVAVPETGVVAVDESWRLYADPAVVDAWTVEQFGSLLVHHVGHLLRDHAGRASDLGIEAGEADRWQAASDAEINDDLEGTGVTLPGEPVTPQALGMDPGRLAEEYFRLMEVEEHEHGDGDCGSGSDAQRREWDEPTDGDNPGIGRSEANLLRCQVASEVLRAAQGPPGTVPSGLRRWAETLLQPKVDWRRALAAEIRRGVGDATGRVDYTYARPSRRAAAVKDVIMPALRRPVPEVAVVVDTSGSMDERTLGRVMSEIDGILRGVGVQRQRLRVLSCDATVHAVQHVSSARQVELYGGGGTNMGAGLDAAVRLRPRPSVVVVLTDGLTPWPREAPKGAAIVVGVIGHEGCRVPSWARSVEIDDVI